MTFRDPKGWELAFRWIKRGPHKETEMLSFDSSGPINSWGCPFCRATALSVSTLAPRCSGGSPHAYVEESR